MPVFFMFVPVPFVHAFHEVDLMFCVYLPFLGCEIQPRWPYMAQSAMLLIVLLPSVASLVPVWTRDLPPYMAQQLAMLLIVLHA